MDKLSTQDVCCIRRTNEQAHERMHEWRSKRTNERMHEWTNKSKHEQVHGWTIERTYE